MYEVKTIKKVKRMVVFGQMGMGKSAFIECLTGQKVKQGNEPTACTQKITPYNMDGYIIYDAPGIDDRNIDTKDWLNMYRKTLQGKYIDMIVCVRKSADYRFTVTDEYNLIFLQSLLDSRKGKGLAFCFTHCDQSNITENQINDLRDQIWKNLGLKLTKSNNFIRFGLGVTKQKDLLCQIQKWDFVSPVKCLKVDKYTLKRAEQYGKQSGNKQVIQQIKQKTEKAKKDCYLKNTIFLRKLKESDDNEEVPATDLKLYDFVLCYDSKSKKLVYSQIYHYNDHSRFKDVKSCKGLSSSYTLVTDQNKKITYSHCHYVLLYNADLKKLNRKEAKDVKVGDKIASITNKGTRTIETIIQIQHEYIPTEDVVSIWTKNPTVIANGFITTTQAATGINNAFKPFYKLATKFPRLHQKAEKILNNWSKN